VLRDRGQASFGVSVQAVMKWNLRYTGRPGSSDRIDAVCDHDRAMFKKHLQAIIVRVGRYTLEDLIECDWTRTARW